MSNSLEMIGKRGDVLERDYSNVIKDYLPNYAEFWYYFIGNDGNNRPLPMPGLDSSAERKRQDLWELLYTLFETVILLYRLKEQVPVRILAGDTKVLLTWLTDLYTWYSLVGRVRDMMKTSSELVRDKLSDDINEDWIDRCTVLHGKTAPLSWQASQVKYASPKPGGWTGEGEGRMLWSEVPDDVWVDLKQVTIQNFEFLADTVNGHYGKMHGKVKDTLWYTSINWENVQDKPGIEPPMQTHTSSSLHVPK